VKSLSPGSEQSSKFRIQKLSLQDWKRHVLGHHLSDHGKFEVEALSADDDCVHVVLLSHVHPFYEPGMGLRTIRLSCSGARTVMAMLSL
jgi:hypothetical protein